MIQFLLSLFHWFSKIVLIALLFLTSGKNQVFALFTKNEKLIEQVHLLCIWENIWKTYFQISFESLDEHKLLSEHQSGFRPNDSCINQLQSIVHDKYSSFNVDPTLEVGGVFLDMTKAFDKVWHEGLIYKLRQVAISGEALAFTNSFLNSRSQCVICNGQSSNQLPIKAGVPQESILGLLFFFVYINDLLEKISSTVKLFADDTSLFSVVNDPDISGNKLNKDLE